MVCLGFKPRVAGSKAQMNPLCYSGTPNKNLYTLCSLPNQNFDDSLLFKMAFLRSASFQIFHKIV